MSKKCLHGMYFQIDGSNPCYYCKRQGLSGPSSLPSQSPVSVDHGVLTKEEVGKLETYPSERRRIKNYESWSGAPIFQEEEEPNPHKGRRRTAAGVILE